MFYLDFRVFKSKIAMSKKVGRFEMKENLFSNYLFKHNKMKLLDRTNEKNRIAIILLLLTTISFVGSNQLFAITPNHFTTVWQGQNGQNHMNFMVVSAMLENLPLAVDDEIAVFSQSKCVGAAKLTKAINSADKSTFLYIAASQDDGSARYTPLGLWSRICTL